MGARCDHYVLVLGMALEPAGHEKTLDLNAASGAPRVVEQGSRERGTHTLPFSVRLDLGVECRDDVTVPGDGQIANLLIVEIRLVRKNGAANLDLLGPAIHDASDHTHRPRVIVLLDSARERQLISELSTVELGVHP